MVYFFLCKRIYFKVKYAMCSLRARSRINISYIGHFYFYQSLFIPNE